MKWIRRFFAVSGLLLGATLLLSQNSLAQKKLDTSESPDPATVKAVSMWLASRAVPLKSIEAGSGVGDLQQLKHVLKGARIVGLGEATHGSREFFQVKHRMIEFLVREMGFTVFAIEASYAACFNINNYVLYGKGDRAQALASQKFWTWDTNEVTDLIDWMRAYNQKAPGGKKVKFLGYDLQNFEQGLGLVEAYLRKVAPEYADRAEATYKPLRMNVMDYQARSDEEKNQTQAQLRELIGFLAFNQTRFVRQTSAAEFELVMQHARIPLQFDESYVRSKKDPGSIFTRDYFMAENIEHLIKSEAPGTKIIVWAHNGHIQTDVSRKRPATGAYLRRVFGEEYYALGVTFNQGGFQAIDLSGKVQAALADFSIAPAPVGSGEWYFARPGIENYIVDFRGAPKQGLVAQWLASTLPMHSIGAAFSTGWSQDKYMSPTVLKDYYDGMIFITKTTRARPNPTGMRPISGRN